MRRYLADVLIQIARRLDSRRVFDAEMSLEIDRLTIRVEAQAAEIEFLREQLE